MKHCPHCNASIENTARFCLYCMTPLEDKQVIVKPTPHHGKHVVVMGTVLALVLVLLLGGMWMPMHSDDEQSQENDTPVVATATTTRTATTTTAENAVTTTTAADEMPDNGSLVTDVTTTQGALSTSADVLVTTQRHNAVTTTPTAKPTTKASAKTTTTTKATTMTKTTTTVKAVVTTTTVATGTDTYSCRAATHDDVYLDATIAVPDDTVVITGIVTRAADGIYRVPNIIDGKRVIAIADGAFSGEDVRVVVLSDNVSTVNSGAFTACPNLTDIYFMDSVYTYSGAFAPVDKRTGTLTFHCPQDCDNRNFRYYRNIADWFDAEFKEWNGGELT